MRKATTRDKGPGTRDECQLKNPSFPVFDFALVPTPYTLVPVFSP
jgi:hypothetical protein